jgi:4-hydroxy-tetrahydrodipicolinate synthase
VMLTPFKDSGEIDWAGYENLINYYIEEGVAGIFAVCTSSEFLHLETNEVIDLARKSVEFSKGRISVIATGNFGQSLFEQIETIQKVADTGVNATVIATSLLPNNDKLLDQILLITDKTDVPLGIYESPLPDHRILTANEVYEVASTKRFFALKETSRDLVTFLEKTRRASGSQFQVFQANLRVFLQSGSHYGAGFMGCLANTFPRLIHDYMIQLRNPSLDIELLRGFMLEAEGVLNKNRYPASAKYVLNRLGVPIKTNCRWKLKGEFDKSNQAYLDLFIDKNKSLLIPCNNYLSLQVPESKYADFISDIAIEIVEPLID